MTIRETLNTFANSLLVPINTAAIVLLGGYTVLWGLWLANPFWTVFTQAALFSTLASLAPEVFWGCLAICCGTATCYGAFTRRYMPLVWGSAIAFWHWLMIAVLYFMGDWHNTGGITALLLCVYAAFIYVNIRVNYKDDHELYKQYHR